MSVADFKQPPATVFVSPEVGGREGAGDACSDVLKELGRRRAKSLGGGRSGPAAHRPLVDNEGSELVSRRADRLQRHVGFEHQSTGQAVALKLVKAGDGDTAGAETILWQASAVAEATGATTERAHIDQLLRQLGIRTWRRGPRARPAGDLSVLSDREREIANLIAGGASNPDIARALFLSRKTVERHVSNILGKLEVRNRAQLAATVAAGDGGRERA